LAKAILTDAAVRGLKAPRGQRLERADELVRGLRVRVTPGSKVWILRQRAGGKVRTITLGAFGDGEGELGLAAARTKAVKVQSEIAEGRVPVPAVSRQRIRQGPTMATVIDQFMIEYCRDKEVKRPEAYRWMFDKYIVPKFGDWLIAAIAKQDLREFLRAVRDNHGLTTARRVGGLCKRLFRWAGEEDTIPVDPMALVTLPGKEAVRQRTLKDEELRAFWLATDPASDPRDLNDAGRTKAHPSMFPWGAYFRLLLLTGQRRGEVANMRWDAIDLKAHTWALEAAQTKSDRAHLVPLSPPVVKLLEALPRITVEHDGVVVPSPYVLTTNGRAPISSFSKAKRWLDDEMVLQLGGPIANWRIHDVRRSVSTALAKLGVEPFIRRRVLNHALEGVDRVYDQFDYLEPKRQALELWARHLAAVVEDGPDGVNVGQVCRNVH
jgi:integrase